MKSLLVAVLGLCAVACEVPVENGVLKPKRVEVGAFTAVRTEASGLAVKDGAAFADQRGGGVFVGTDGGVVRLRADGSRAPLESHPGNVTKPGVAASSLTLSPFTALVTASNGLFVAEAGWVIEVPWRVALPTDGALTSVLGDDGVTWLLHTTGLFRLEGGELSELQLSGKSLTGYTRLTAAPSPTGASAVWFASNDKLFYAEPRTRPDVLIGEELMPAEVRGDGIRGLAGLTAAKGNAGELWVVTGAGLFRRESKGWQPYDLGSPVDLLLSSGRHLWARAASSIFHFNGDTQTWAVAALSTEFTLIAADPAGAIWVKAGEKTFSVSEGPIARIDGVFEGEKVFRNESVIRVTVPISLKATGAKWRIDDGMPTAAKAREPLNGVQEFGLGGIDAAEKDRPVQLGSLSDGLHTLTVDVTLEGGPTVIRRLHFDYRSGPTMALSYATDMQPIFTARCAKCHTSKGPGHDMDSYGIWKAEAEKISNAVAEGRMPADGVLDPATVQKIVRWANQGAPP